MSLRPIPIPLASMLVAAARGSDPGAEEDRGGVTAAADEGVTLGAIDEPADGAEVTSARIATAGPIGTRLAEIIE